MDQIQINVMIGRILTIQRPSFDFLPHSDRCLVSLKTWARFFGSNFHCEQNVNELNLGTL